MNERIRELATSNGIFDSLCDPFDQLKNDDCYSSVMIDLEKFAQLIVRECAEWVNDNVGLIDEEARADLLKHFGVEE